MLTILFLCGSLEPGKDGVGDYSRRIAGQIAKSGHNVRLIALNDSFVTEVVNKEQEEYNLSLPTLRLPSSISLRDRLQYLLKVEHQLKPDWVSLQYVPYSFHPKGLPFKWIQQFKRIAPTAQWHIMMHELWIGSKLTDSLKDKLVGYFQKQIIKYTLNNIHPSTITTSLPYYEGLLKTIGYSTSVIPIFNNIGTGNANNTTLYQQLISFIPDPSDYYIGVLFGGLHADTEVYQNVALLVHLAEKENKKLLLVHVGRSGAVDNFFATIRQRYTCTCISLGEKDPADIASFFYKASFGVSTYSAAFLNKSGSVAAMPNNKLPVILLKRMEIQTNVRYEYAKHISEIDSLANFKDQPRNWSDLYGLENAVRFYNNLFLNDVTQ